MREPKCASSNVQGAMCKHKCASVNVQAQMYKHQMCKPKCASANVQAQVCKPKRASINVQAQMCKRKMCKPECASANVQPQLCKPKCARRYMRRTGPEQKLSVKVKLEQFILHALYPVTRVGGFSSFLVGTGNTPSSCLML